MSIDTTNSKIWQFCQSKNASDTSNCSSLFNHYQAKSDKEWMQLALILASYAHGQTGSNPCVGAVIVKEGRLIGFGSHLRQGEPHAEIHALNMAGPKAKGATLYVTLEPCCHQGLTAPCADAVIKANISKVFVATMDLNQKVAGRGIEKLKKAGIEVNVGLYEQEASLLLHEFFKTQKNKRSYVILKSATSLDGKLALENLESQWVTGQDARNDVHHLRSNVDAILTAIGTVNKDNPSLNARLESETRQPARIVIDRNGNIDQKSNVVKTAKLQRTILFGQYAKEKQQQLENAGCEIVEFIDLNSLLEWSLQAGFMRVMVEAGPKLVTSLLEEDLVDEWISYQSPRVFGGSQALYLNIKTLPIEQIETFELIRSEILGNDLKIIMRKQTKTLQNPLSLKTSFIKEKER